ncbi:MAG: hypothetical protein Q8O76_10140, partial [Chloroflexota bacterium]|nr:hypothetical protein [Chloroflexota bacterium]
MSTPWAGRLEAVGKAQERYLWFLLFAGVFYAAVGVKVDETVVMPLPFVGVELKSAIVWATGPAVISFIILVIHGTLRAAKTAEENLEKVDAGIPFEAYDKAPNAIDLAVYTSHGMPGWLQDALYVSYPLYLGVFALEAGVLLWAYWTTRPMGLWWLVGAAGSTMVWVAATATTL